MAKEGEEIGELAIKRESHGSHLRGIGADLMAKNVIGRETDSEQVSGMSSAEILVNH